MGAGIFQLYNSVSAPNSAAPLSQDQAYLNAIEDAMVAKPSEVYNGLTPIVENNSTLVWEGTPGNESVLMVTWTRYASSYHVN